MPYKDPNTRREYMAQWRAKNKRRYAAYRATRDAKLANLSAQDRHLRKRYGITLAERDAMLVAQGNKCGNPGCAASSAEKYEWDTDHDHTTGEVRGILCRRCNLLLGFFENEPERLAGLKKYLAR